MGGKGLLPLSCRTRGLCVLRRDTRPSGISAAGTWLVLSLVILAALVGEAGGTSGLALARQRIQIAEDLPYFGTIPVIEGAIDAENLTYSAESALPPGVRVDAKTGQIRGIPVEPGNYTGITLVVRDELANETLVLGIVDIIVTKSLDLYKDEVENGPSPKLGESFVWLPSDTIKDELVGDILFFLDGTLPRGLTFNPLTGEIKGIPIETGNYGDIFVYVTDGINIALVSTFSDFTVKGLDCSQPSFGPNARGCGIHGVCLDELDKFDGKFACACKSGWQGENCEFQVSQSSGSDNTAPIVGGVVALVAIILAVVVLVFISNLKKMAKVGLAPVETDTFRFPPRDEWEFPLDQLQIASPLGEGNFGQVNRAAALNIRGLPGVTDVAVKQCGGKLGISNELKARFVKEAQAMKRFDHENVLRLLGVCLQSDPLYIITEFMENGDLHNFLRVHHEVTLPKLCEMGVDIANGLSYLHSLKFIHGDLACRNCLVGTDLNVKIADFGLSKDTSYKGYYYRANSQTIPLPVRWMAPECLKFGEYTASSDVWSLGVVLWELMTHCEMPYPALGNQEVYNKVLAGHRMSRPPRAPIVLYELMIKCWSMKIDERPRSEDVLDEMRKIAARYSRENAGIVAGKLRRFPVQSLLGDSSLRLHSATQRRDDESISESIESDSRVQSASSGTVGATRSPGLGGVSPLSPGSYLPLALRPSLLAPVSSNMSPPVIPPGMQSQAAYQAPNSSNITSPPGGPTQSKREFSAATEGPFSPTQTSGPLPSIAAASERHPQESSTATYIPIPSKPPAPPTSLPPPLRIPPVSPLAASAAAQASSTPMSPRAPPGIPEGLELYAFTQRGDDEEPAAAPTLYTPLMQSSPLVNKSTKEEVFGDISALKPVGPSAKRRLLADSRPNWEPPARHGPTVDFMKPSLLPQSIPPPPASLPPPGPIVRVIPSRVVSVPSFPSANKPATGTSDLGDTDFQLYEVPSGGAPQQTELYALPNQLSI